jgi:hypothetical protein
MQGNWSVPIWASQGRIILIPLLAINATFTYYRAPRNRVTR